MIDFIKYVWGLILAHETLVVAIVGLLLLSSVKKKEFGITFISQDLRDLFVLLNDLCKKTATLNDTVLLNAYVSSPNNKIPQIETLIDQLRNSGSRRFRKWYKENSTKGSSGAWSVTLNNTSVNDLFIVIRQELGNTSIYIDFMYFLHKKIRNYLFRSL